MEERLAWRRARSNVEASVDRVIAEPGITALRRDTLRSMLASSHSLMLAIVGLEAVMLHRQTLTPAEALHTFAQDVDLTLYYLAGALRGSKPAGRKFAAVARRPPQAGGSTEELCPKRRFRLSRDGQAYGKFEYASRTSDALRGCQASWPVYRVAQRVRAAGGSDPVRRSASRRQTGWRVAGWRGSSYTLCAPQDQ